MKLSYRTRVAEVNAVASSIIKLIDHNQLSNDVHLKATVEELANENRRLSATFGNPRSGSQLAELDKKRDEQLLFIGSILKTCLKFPEPEVREAAMIITEKVWMRYGTRIARENYAASTGLIEALLGEMQNSEIKIYSRKIAGLSASLDALSVAQNDFCKAETEYRSACAKVAKKDKSSDLGHSVLKIINEKLTVILDGLRIALPDQFAVLANEVDEVIKANNLKIDMRQTAKERNNEPSLKAAVVKPEPAIETEPKNELTLSEPIEEAD